MRASWAETPTTKTERKERAENFITKADYHGPRETRKARGAGWRLWSEAGWGENSNERGR